MQLDIAQTDVVTTYRMLIDLVVPRPIAWVTSVDASGRVNLAPFSFFNAFGANPPIVVFSPTLRRDASPKDTLRNVRETGEFVVNVANEAMAEQVNASSADFPPDVSEPESLGIDLVPSTRVRPPRVAGSPAHLECRVRQIVDFGEAPLAPNLVIGEILVIHVDDSVIVPSTGRVDPRRLQAIARLGGDYYCRSTDLFTQIRPSPPA